MTLFLQLEKPQSLPGILFRTSRNTYENNINLIKEGIYGESRLSSQLYRRQGL